MYASFSSKYLKPEQYLQLIDSARSDQLVRAIETPVPGGIYLIQHDNLDDARSVSDSLVWKFVSRNVYKSGLKRVTYNLGVKFTKDQARFTYVNEFTKTVYHHDGSLTSLVHYLGDLEKFDVYLDNQIHGNATVRKVKFNTTAKSVKQSIKSMVKPGELKSNKHVYRDLKNKAAKDHQIYSSQSQCSSSPAGQQSNIPVLNSQLNVHNSTDQQNNNSQLSPPSSPPSSQQSTVSVLNGHSTEPTDQQDNNSQLSPPSFEQFFKPRNTKQVANHRHLELQKLKVFPDEIMNALAFSSAGLDHYIYDIRILPDRTVFLGHRGAIELTKRQFSRGKYNS